MNPTTEKAIKKIIEAGKITPVNPLINHMSSGNISFRFEDAAGKLIAQFSLASLVKKRTPKKKKVKA